MKFKYETGVIKVMKPDGTWMMVGEITEPIEEFECNDCAPHDHIFEKLNRIIRQVNFLTDVWIESEER